MRRTWPDTIQIMGADVDGDGGVRLPFLLPAGSHVGIMDGPRTPTEILPRNVGHVETSQPCGFLSNFCW